MITTLLRSMRIPFLVLTPVSVFLGYCAAMASHGTADPLLLALILIGAVSAHISVNTFNEYFDYRSGLDALTTKTPFSGGSGALVDDPEAAERVWLVAMASLILTMLIGVYFITMRGALILPVGIAGILIILTYTRWLNRNPWLCLFAPGLAIGPLMVMGTAFVLTGEYAMNAAIISMVPFFLANNLLLLNQFPDVEADRRVGRRHFPIAYGITGSIAVAGIFILALFAVVGAGISSGYLPGISYLALLPMAGAVLALAGAARYADNTRRLLPFLALNVLATVLTPLILGLVILSMP